MISSILNYYNLLRQRLEFIHARWNDAALRELAAILVGFNEFLHPRQLGLVGHATGIGFEKRLSIVDRCLFAFEREV